MGEAKRKQTALDAALANETFTIITVTNQLGGKQVARSSSLTITEAYEYIKQMILGKRQSSVPCSGCTSCCYHKDIGVKPDEVSKYEVEPSTNVNNKTGWSLKHKDDGSCVYLGEKGCTIYDSRPSICWKYDCRLASFARYTFAHGDIEEPLWTFQTVSDDDIILQIALESIILNWQANAKDPTDSSDLSQTVYRSLPEAVKYVKKHIF